MITGIFITTVDTYVCSNQVEMTFGCSVVKAHKCFVAIKPLELYQEVKCLLKFENAAAMCFVGYVKSFEPNGDLVLSIGSDLSENGVEEILTDIRNFNLYLLREESQ